jgi:hypothetical protein
VQFEVLKSGVLRTYVFLDVMVCRVSGFQRSESASILPSVDGHSTQSHSPEDLNSLLE